MILVDQDHGVGPCVAVHEKAMADWLHQHLKPTLEQYLELKGQGRDAAH